MRRSSLLSRQEAGLILITGASGGIGGALAVELLQRGYPVLATARKRSSLAALERLGAEIEELDVASDESIAALELPARGIGIVVNNAGYGVMGPLIEVAPADLRRQFETNVFAPLALSAAIVPSMIARGRGRIVDVSSVSGVTTTPFAGAYCASKAALNALDEALRMELGPFGIDVITLQPGAIRSSFAATAAAGFEPRATGVERFYGALDDAIRARARASEHNAMPADAFARRAVDAILAQKPAPIVRIGPYARQLPALRRWLPTRVRERLLSRRAHLDRLVR